MKSLILATTQKQSFNGQKLGFVLESTDESGANDIYYPFFQGMVTEDAVGKFLIVETKDGNKSERIVIRN